MVNGTAFFTNAAVMLNTTSATLLYTCPTTVISSIIHTLVVANEDPVNEPTVTIQVLRNADSTMYTIGNQFPVPVQTTFSYREPINLNTGDQVFLTADIATELQGFASILELS